MQDMTGEQVHKSTSSIRKENLLKPSYGLMIVPFLIMVGLLCEIFFKIIIFCGRYKNSINQSLCST